MRRESVAEDNLLRVAADYADQDYLTYLTSAGSIKLHILMDL